MIPALLVLSGSLAFAPLAPSRRLRHASRASPLGVSPPQPELLVLLPAASQLHGVADMALRQAVYAFRIVAGVGVDGAVAPSEQMRDVRMLLTASTVGTVRAAQGVSAAWCSGAWTEFTMHFTMLLYHPLELCRWALRVVDRAAPALRSPPVAVRASAQAATAFAGALWLVWIFSTGLIALRSLRGAAVSRERRVHTLLRLSKLSLDVPLATHFLCGGSLLPLVAVGALGFVSSFLGVRAALTDPSAEPVAASFAMPAPLLRLRSRSRCSAAPLDWGMARLVPPASPCAARSPRGLWHRRSTGHPRWPLR